MYHQGNGLTVERDKVEVYAELANILFENLFGFRLVEPDNNDTALLGEFIQSWVNLETAMYDVASAINARDSNKSGKVIMPLKVAEILTKAGYMSLAELSEVNQLRQVRNEVVHGTVNYRDLIKPEMVKRLFSITQELQRRLQSHLDKMVANP